MMNPRTTNSDRLDSFLKQKQALQNMPGVIATWGNGYPRADATAIRELREVDNQIRELLTPKP